MTYCHGPGLLGLASPPTGRRVLSDLKCVTRDDPSELNCANDGSAEKTKQNA